MQPFVFGQVLDYFTPHQTTLTDQEGLYYILVLIVLLALQAIVHHHAVAATLHVGLKVRAICCGAVYSRAINSAKQELENFASIPQIINILTNTATHIELGFVQIHSLFLVPFEIVTVGICLYFHLGYSGLAGLSVYVLVFVFECTYCSNALFRTK